MASAVTWQSDSPEKLLAERFHISAGFHAGQRDIIEQLVQGKRLLVIQRTGWGKSLCYQMASLYYPHLTIVFSPLKALMRDQCQRCNIVYNIPSAIVSSEFSPQENRTTLAQAIEGRFKILFIAPERLDNADGQIAVPKMRISMIVIDEAHCISTWGHDFRPHYQRIVRLVSALPKNVPVLALTATANKRVEDDVLGQIGVASVVRSTMYRPNLYLNVVKAHGDWDKLCYLGEVLLHRSDTGMVYTATRSSAVMVATFLQQQGLKAEYYHADREDSVRREIEQKFMMNQYNVICSTNALGMGIDKPDIRFVIHYHMPASPINYYQEIGRAGRDRNVAYCVLLYDTADSSIQEHLIARDRSKKRNLEAVLLQKQQELGDMQNYAQTNGCYMEYLTGYFGNESGYRCGVCGNCRKENFPQVLFGERIRSATNYFMEEGFSSLSVDDYPHPALRQLTKEKRMNEKLQEQVYWLLLAFGSGLPKGVINAIIVTWCQQSGQSLQEFFSAEPQTWSDICQLDASTVAKLEKVRTKTSSNYSKQLTLLEQLAHDRIYMLTMLDDNYPGSLNTLLPPDQRPPVLFYCGDLEILNFPTIAIIGSRHANEESLMFTREVAQCLTEQGANVISGYARGVDQAAFRGATSSSGNTTVVLPQGMTKSVPLLPQVPTKCYYLLQNARVTRTIVL